MSYVPLEDHFILICDMSHKKMSLIFEINLARVDSYVPLEHHFVLMCDMSHETVSLIFDNLTV